VQQKEDQSESRTKWIGYMAVAGDGGGRHRAHSAGATSSWRGAAPSRYIVLEYLKDVNLKYTSAMSVLDCNFSEVKVHRTHELVMGCPNSGILVTFSARDPSPCGYSVLRLLTMGVS
jgi:hypothetical protein